MAKQPTTQTTKQPEGRSITAGNIEALIEHWSARYESILEDIGNGAAGFNDAEGALGAAEMLREAATIAETMGLLMTLIPMPQNCPSCGYDLLRHAQREAADRRMMRDNHDAQEVKATW